MSIWVQSDLGICQSIPEYVRSLLFVLEALRHLLLAKTNVGEIAGVVLNS